MTRQEAVELLATCLDRHMLGKPIDRIKHIVEINVGGDSFTEAGDEEWRKRKNLAERLLDALPLRGAFEDPALLDALPLRGAFEDPALDTNYLASFLDGHAVALSRRSADRIFPTTVHAAAGRLRSQQKEIERLRALTRTVWSETSLKAFEALAERIAAQFSDKPDK